MANICKEYIYNIVEKVATACNLRNWQHSVNNFESIGQNYFGIVMPVSLKGYVDNQEMEIHVVLKFAPTDERYRVSGAITHMFLRETYVYSKLLQKYIKLCKNFPLDMQYVIPKLYYYCDDYCKEAIVMQDMSFNGFKPYINKIFLDMEHVTIALKSLARFHSLSFILQAKDNVLYDEIATVCEPLTEKNNKRYCEIMIDRLSKALVKFEGTDYEPLLKNLRDNCGVYFSKMIEFAAKKCIGHGDMWKENILFKYENNQPISACLIDYQTTRTICPAFDALYLIISSTKTHTRKTLFPKLINSYYETLKNMLELAGLDSKEIYSLEELNHDLKIVAPTCLIVANTALWLSHGLQEEGHVRSKQIFETEEEKNQAIDDYKQVIQSIIDDFYCYGYLPVKFII